MPNQPSKEEVLPVALTRPLWSLMTGAPVFKQSQLANAEGKHQMAIAFPTQYGPIFVPLTKHKLRVEEFCGMLNMPITLEQKPQDEESGDKSPILT